MKIGLQLKVSVISVVLTFLLASCATQPMVPPPSNDNDTPPVTVNPVGTYTGTLTLSGVGSPANFSVAGSAGAYTGQLADSSGYFENLGCNVGTGTMTCIGQGSGLTVSMDGALTATQYSGIIVVTGNQVLEGKFQFSKSGG